MTMQALLHEAGVYPGAPGSSADAFPVDPVKWEYFKNWFLKALNVLLHVSTPVYPMPNMHAATLPRMTMLSYGHVCLVVFT